MSDTPPDGRPAQTSAPDSPPQPPTPEQVAAGPKPWIELTADERIERLRHVVRGQDRALDELRRLVFKLTAHQHGADGRMVAPIAWGELHPAHEPMPDAAKAWL